MESGFEDPQPSKGTNASTSAYVIGDIDYAMAKALRRKVTKVVALKVPTMAESESRRRQH